MRKQKARNEPEETEHRKLKKAKCYKASQRDGRHHCRVGAVVNISGNHYLVCVTTSLFVYIVKQNGNHKRLTWQNWDKLKPHLESPAVLMKWTKKLKQSVSFLRRKVKFENKLKSKIKVKREPVIKRTPVKRKKKKRGHRRIKKWKSKN